MQVPAGRHIDRLIPFRLRPAPGRLMFGALQLVFWGLFGVVFFLTIRPLHPFADILLGQTTATALLGLAFSTGLERLYALLYRRVPQPVAAAGLLAGSVVAGLAWEVLAAWASAVIDPFEGLLFVTVPGGVPFGPALRVAFPAVLLFWSLLLLGAVHWREQQDQKERVLRSEALAHEARLRMLRYQLNPHFLFNALNSIGALAGEAPHRIQRMVGELSGFLRYSLLDPEALEVPLGDELRAVAHYLEVEKVRFEDDLEVRLEVEPEAAGRVVPAFLVLPLVENAVKYGQHTSPMPLRIHVSGRVEGRALCVEVKNTGRWVAPSRPEAGGTGTGLDNVRQRLAELYPGRHRLDVFEEGAWVHARIRIDDGGR